jgi:hypothetical protein
MRITVIPTLAHMAAVYALPRDGGAASPRFRAYTEAAATTWALSAYNPMAGAHAAAAVQALLALDAERLVAEAAAKTAARVDAHTFVPPHDPPRRLAVVVLSAGLWTERLTTDSLHRTHGAGGWHRGLVPCWSHEPVTEALVHAQAVRETARMLWEAVHGPARSVRGVLAREGVAEALAHITLASAPEPPDAVDDPVREAVAVLGESTALADVVAVLLGDTVAEAHGWRPLGIAADGGVQLARSLARSAIAQRGARAVLLDGAASWLDARP